jgi:hypothetical protein
MADCVRQFSIDARGDYLLDRSPMMTMMTFKTKIRSDAWPLLERLS